MSAEGEHSGSDSDDDNPTSVVTDAGGAIAEGKD